MDRLIRHHEETIRDEEAGFRPDRSTVDQAYGSQLFTFDTLCDNRSGLLTQLGDLKFLTNCGYGRVRFLGH
ncbi:hypothetical protein RB195_018532 [Necator americanus]|uniref:Reverse transcriptase domain-containing protein n=1 Tax=Necator americanus TaxID=51031 RepID=A0ABR1CA71_NECAM